MNIPLNRKILLMSALKANGKSIDAGPVSACSGHFNVIHPGHHRFLHFVRDHGNHLVVLVLGDHLLEQRQLRRLFSQEERANGVASLEFVDSVILVDQGPLEEALRYLRPAVFSFGREFEVDRRGEIEKPLAVLAQIGSRVVFGAGDIAYSRSDLFDRSVIRIADDRLGRLKNACDRNGVDLHDLPERIKEFQNRNILVIGDSIVDHFVACDAVGMSAEAPVLAVKEIEKKSFIGGAAIVASHVSAMGARCSFLSVVGADEPAQFLEDGLRRNGVHPILFTDSDRPTTFKIRYMVDNQKLLRVSRLHENHIPVELEKKIIDQIRLLGARFDGIIVSDFVYGLITPAIMAELSRLAEANEIMLFGDLQCSSQIGNVTKFKGFDLITPTEREVRIALSDNDSGIEKLAANLLETTSCKNLMITLGADGAVAYQSGGVKGVSFSEHFPALVANPTDVAGAGDTLLSAASLALASGFSITEASLLGSFAAAIAVSRIGNIPVTHEELAMLLQQASAQIRSESSFAAG